MNRLKKAFIEEPNENELTVDDLIDHPKFGEGQVIDVAEKTVKIKFDDDTKELLSSFAAKFKI